MGWADRVKKSLLGAVEEDEAAVEAPAAVAAVPDAVAAPADLVDALRHQLVKISEGKVGYESIDPSGHIFDYGYVDSLSAVMFLAHIEHHYGVQISDVEIVEQYNTLDTIAARIHALQ